MSELPSGAFNKKQVWEMATWKPEFEKAAIGVVARFSDSYKLSEEWQDLIESQLLPAIHGERLDPVRFPGPGFLFLFVPSRDSFEEREDAVHRLVENPRFQFAESRVRMPNIKSRIATFGKSYRLMSDLAEEYDLDMFMTPPMLVLPKRRFSKLDIFEIPALND